jgi:L-ectoine synthase
MTIKIIRKHELAGTKHHVRNETYETFRFLLAEDGVDVTVTDIVIHPGIEATYGYDENIEIAYCIQGRATLTDIESNLEHTIEPGSMWVAPKGSRFKFLAKEPTRLICVFRPAFSGKETGFAGDQ